MLKTVLKCIVGIRKLYTYLKDKSHVAPETIKVTLSDNISNVSFAFIIPKMKLEFAKRVFEPELRHLFQDTRASYSVSPLPDMAGGDVSVAVAVGIDAEDIAVLFNEDSIAGVYKMLGPDLSSILLQDKGLIPKYISPLVLPDEKSH